MNIIKFKIKTTPTTIRIKMYRKRKKKFFLEYQIVFWFNDKSFSICIISISDSIHLTILKYHISLIQLFLPLIVKKSNKKPINYKNYYLFDFYIY